MSQDQLQQVNEMIRSGPDLGSLPVPELRVAFDGFGDFTPFDSSIEFELVDANGAVSYTHLDVYKRQNIHTWLPDYPILPRLRRH